MRTRAAFKIEARVARQRQRVKDRAEFKRQLARREPKKCAKPLCDLQARHGCTLCEQCRGNEKFDKQQINLLCQGCPSLARKLRHGETIQWTMDAPTIADWIHTNLELSEGKSCNSSSAKWLEVVGWKGYRDVNQERDLDGNTSNCHS